MDSSKKQINISDNLQSSKKIFIAPLDWGLGHTTRCIPIAIELHKQGHEIVFGVNSTQRSLLEKEISFASYIHFEGYNIQYPKIGSMTAKMLIQIPKIITRIQSENKELQTLIDRHNFDLIISDNRFGLHTRKVPCIYITHQINIEAPIFKQALHNLHKTFINKYTHCWIPDYKDNIDNLSGELSHKNFPKNGIFIGPQSRFTTPAKETEIVFDYLAIISGPEPQRTLFEEIIIQNFAKSNKKCAIISGKPTNNSVDHINNVTLFSHLDSNTFYKIVSESKNVLCRPGYSSIMDFHVLQKPIHVIPTPGQTEQEYLAKYHEKNGIEWSQQQDFKLSHMLFHKLPKQRTNSKLREAIKTCIN